jgi:hypothetical protein
VTGIATEYGLPYRRAYEFFNLLSALGVCSRSQHGEVTWAGLQEVSRTFSAAYTKIEVD